MGLKWLAAFCILLLIALLPACSQSEEETGDSEITANAVAKIYRACPYPNGDFCDSECCASDDRCNGRDSFKKCDLENGKWKDDVYSNSKCSEKCAMAGKNSQPGCTEGWECVDESYRGYKTADCKWSDIEKCPQSCKNGECSSYACTPPAMRCFGNELKVCALDGSSWGLVERCKASCVDGECTGGAATEGQQASQGVCDSCIEILQFNYDPEGNECNTDDEFVEFRNKCSNYCDLDGWKVSDSSSKTYTFTGIALGGGDRVKLYSGQGSNDASNVYWGNSRGCVWNNDGDTLTMKSSNGKIVLTNTY